MLIFRVFRRCRRNLGLQDKMWPWWPGAFFEFHDLWFSMLVFLMNKKYSYCLSGRLWRVFWSGGQARFYAYEKILLGPESRFGRKNKGNLMARRGGDLDAKGQRYLGAKGA